MIKLIISKIKEFFGIYEMDYDSYNDLPYSIRNGLEFKDRENFRRYDEDELPEIITEDVHISMPIIEPDPNEGPRVVITRDWYYREKKEEARKRARQRKECQIEMIELIARKEHTFDKIKSLVPTSDKDYEKLSNWYADIKNIDAELKFLEMESGIQIENVFHESKFERYKMRQRRKFKKIKKKFKKFYKKNRYAICEIALVVSVFIGKLFIGKLF